MKGHTNPITYRGRLLAFFVVALFARHADAQVVIGPPRISNAPLPRSQSSTQTAGKPGSLSSLRSAIMKQGPLFQWGKVAVRPHTTYSILYGNGLLRVPGEPVNSTLQTFSQGVLFELGTTWTFDATLSRSVHSSRLLVDTYDSTFRLSGRWTFDDWTFAVTQSFATNSPIVVETGSQNEEETMRSSFDAAYAPGEKLSIDSSIAWSQRLADPKLRNATWTGSDWKQLTATLWINYQIGDRTNVSIGASAGQDELNLGNDMTYTQPQARIRWRPTDRISVGVGGGVESRRVKGPGGENSETPVYDANVSYNPTLTTSLSFSFSRNISNSYFNNQTIRGTQLSASLSQRLLQQFFFSLGASEGRSRYAATSTFFFTDRDDKYRSYTAAISTAFLRRGSASLSYSKSRNSSNTSEYRYSSNQYGADISYRF